MRLDFIDYPTGWELQAELGTDSPPHDPECSAVASDGAMLCDCDAIVTLWVEHGGNRERYPRDATPAGKAEDQFIHVQGV
jgi:hypothetical protein